MSKHPTLVLLDSLNNALVYALETATCLVIFYLLYHFLFRKESSFQYNRFYLLTAVLISFSFPLMNVGYNPDKTLGVLNSLHQASAVVSQEPIIAPKGFYSVTVMATSEKPFLLWWEAVMLVYGLVFIGLGLRLFIQVRSFKDYLWYKRHNTRYKDNFFIVNTEGTMPTFAFFKYLMWDDSLNLSAEEKKQVIDHEKVHINQRHSYDIMLLEVLKVIFWFNPFIYLYRILIEEAHEYEADHKAVKVNDKAAYTKLLVKLVFKKMGLAQGSFFAKNKTLKRVNMITSSKRVSWFKLIIPVPVAALLFFIFSCEARLNTDPVTVADVAYVYTSFGQEDIKPIPKDGYKDWKNYLLTNIQYPKQLTSNKKEGRVMVSFLINEFGDVKDVRLVEGISKEFNDQVINTIKNSPQWNPGYKEGQNVSTRIEVPVTFKAS